MDKPGKHHGKKSQTQNTTHYMIPLYEMSTVGKSIETEASLTQWI